jgi:hypothetical protein
MFSLLRLRTSFLPSPPLSVFLETKKTDRQCRYAAVLVVFVSGNIAANPVPTVCMLADSNGNVMSANANGSSTASPLLDTMAPATVTAMATSTLTFSETGSVRTILSTVTSTILSTPTADVKKGDMSGIAKTGIGVGSAVGVLLVLVLVGGVVAWVREKGWFGEGGAFAHLVRRKGNQNGKMERRGGGRPGRSASGSRVGKEKGKGKVGVDERENGGHVVWV